MLAVTGITGHTGNHFLNDLVKNQFDDEIKCLVRSSSKTEKLLSCGLEIKLVEGNLNDDDAIRRLLRSADTVVHIAGIRYSPQILRIGRECGVKRFIMVHTTGMYSKYKAASEMYISIENQIEPYMQECNITVVRPTMIFGDICDYNISKFIRFVDKLPVLPVVAGGHALIQPINARDLAHALYLILQSEKICSKAYDLSGESAISVRNLYKMISQCLGKKRVVVGIPMWICEFGAKLLRILTMGKIDIVEKVLRLNENRAYSHETAKCDFGYTPEVFAIGLQREVDEYISKYRK